MPKLNATVTVTESAIASIGKIGYPAPAHDDQTKDRERHHQVVADEHGPARGVTPSFVELVQVHVLRRPEDVPDPTDAGQHDDGGATQVVLDVRRRLVGALGGR